MPLKLMKPAEMKRQGRDGNECRGDSFCEAAEAVGAEDQDGYDDGGRVAGRSTSPKLRHNGTPGEVHQKEERRCGVPGRGDCAFPATHRRSKQGEHDIRASPSCFIAYNLGQHPHGNTAVKIEVLP
jgi:hypothetical protein